jgi:hypothetical protein
MSETNPTLTKWKGRYISDLTRDELLEAVEFLSKLAQHAGAVQGLVGPRIGRVAGRRALYD